MTKDPKRGQLVMSILVLIAFVAILLTLFFVDVSESSRTIVEMGVGILGFLVLQSGSWWWGSTDGSADKTVLLAQLLNKGGGRGDG